MIIDFQADPDVSADLAARLTLIDLDTGAMLDAPIWYADDERGIYRRYLLDAEGQFVLDPDDPHAPAWEERTGRIRFVPRGAA